jgi:ATP-dependent helicase HrpA
VTVHIPLPVLSQVSADGFDWQVPGLRQELVTALIRSLPKPLRRTLVPVPDIAKAVLARMTPRAEPLLRALERELGRLGNVTVPRAAWQLERVPDHLTITFRVVDDQSRTLAAGKDLEALKLQLRGTLQATLSAGAGGIERTGLRTWSVGTLPQTVQQRRAGHVVTAYPALVDEGDSAAVRVLESEAEQRRAMWQGTRRLLLLSMPSPVKLIQGRLTNEAKLALGRHPHRSVTDLLDDCVTCAADKLLTGAGGPAWDDAGFAALRDTVRGALHDAALDVVAQVQRILAAASRIEARLESMANPAYEPALADVRAQLSGLVYPGFVTATGWQRLADLLRYLHAIERRLDKLPGNARRDGELMRTVQALAQSYQRLLEGTPPSGPAADALTEIRWMIEELRVSSFAQTLGTPYPVSEKRILQAMSQL